MRREGPDRVDLVVEQLRRQVPGGIGTYCRGLLRGLSALGEGAPPLRLRASRSPRGAPDPLSVMGWPLRTSALPSRLLTRAWDRGLSLGFAKDASLVHTTSLAAPPVGEVPLVATVHDLAWRRFPEAYPARGRAWHEAALGRLARSASAFVVPSELTAAELLEAGFGIAEEQVVVVEEGLDHLEEPDEAAAGALLSRLGLGPEEGYLLSVSTLEPRKNLARLVAAYRAARPELPEPWPLVVVGPPGWGEWPEEEAGRAEGVVFAGRVDGGALSALYRRARCLAYVPLLEGFGLPAGEALASGTPVVATAGLPSTAGACVEVDPHKTEEISAGLLLAAVEGPGRQALVEAGRRRASSLTWKACAAGHVALWRFVEEEAERR